jgi:hypothetical protein
MLSCREHKDTKLALNGIKSKAQARKADYQSCVLERIALGS